MNEKTVAALLMAAALPAAALAQSADTTYCRALSATYDKYVNNPSMGRGNQPPVAGIGRAQSQCDDNPAAAIPVLEKALRDARISLPPRAS
jgi:hypothetical protein